MRSAQMQQVKQASVELVVDTRSLLLGYHESLAPIIQQARACRMLGTNDWDCFFSLACLLACLLACCRLKIQAALAQPLCAFPCSLSSFRLDSILAFILSFLPSGDKTPRRGAAHWSMPRSCGTDGDGRPYQMYTPTASSDFKQ